MLSLTSLVSLALLLGCDRESSELPSAPEVGIPARQVAADELPHYSEWSEPVNLGSMVNSAFLDINPSLSADGLRLYFVSRRPGGFGLNDIWASRRASVDSPWEAPVNLGPAINSPFNDQGPQESHDGRLLFFTSAGRPGGHGAADLWVSHRTDPQDDLAWGQPVNLGPSVNTPEGEREAQYVVGVEGGLVGRPAILYFNRGNIALQGSDLYAVPVTSDGEPLGAVVLLAELSAPGANETGQSVRRWRETVSVEPGRYAGPGTSGPPPAAAGPTRGRCPKPAPVNTCCRERPALSFDGLTLLFDSDRPGAVGSAGDRTSDTTQCAACSTIENELFEPSKPIARARPRPQPRLGVAAQGEVVAVCADRARSVANQRR
jgi:hypothetical protein